MIRKGTKVDKNDLEIGEEFEIWNSRFFFILKSHHKTNNIVLN